MNDAIRQAGEAREAALKAAKAEAEELATAMHLGLMAAPPEDVSVLRARRVAILDAADAEYEAASQKINAMLRDAETE